MNWQQEKPTEPGDWLWVCMWSCGCCPRRAGIAYVAEGGVFSWQHNDPPTDVTAWMKIELPPREWAE